MTMWQELEKLNNTPREDLQPIRIHLVGGATDPPAVNAAKTL